MLHLLGLLPSLVHLSPGCHPMLRSHTRAHISASETTAALSTRDAAILFGKMAEQNLFLDAAVGACCHSACSDCEWRLPDGGYRWDVLRATKPKWLPLYFKRDFNDERGCGIPRWAAALFPACVDDIADKTPVTRAQFSEALTSLEFQMPMGPRGNIAAGAELSDAAVDALWAYVADGADALAPAAMCARLQAMAEDPNGDGAIGEGPDSLVWKEFAMGLGAKPFEMIV